MAEKRTWTCSVCGTEKREANHWFVLLQSDGALAGSHGTYEGPWLEIYPWNDVAAKEEAASHLCGERCLTKLLSALLSNLKPAGELRPERRTHS